MNELSKLILEKYLVRQRKEQKAAFRNLVKEMYPEARVETSGKLPANNNVVLGDPDSAEVIIAAHYDTCVVLPFPNLIFVNNILGTIFCTLIILAPLLIAFIGVEFLSLYYLGTFGLFVVFAMLAGMIVYLVAGPPNKHTVNDNTSGTIAVLELYEKLPSEVRNRCCFVLFDNEENGLIGSREFKKLHPTTARNALMLNFDCIGDGEYLMMVYSRVAEEEREGLQAAFPETKFNRPKYRANFSFRQFFPMTFYPSDQLGYKKHVGFVAMHRSFLGYYIPRIHTKRDTVLKEENLEYLTSGIERFLQGYLE